MSGPGPAGDRTSGATAPAKVAHLTTTDMSLRFLLLAQLRGVLDAGGEAIGISAPGPWVGDLERAGIRHVPLRSSTRAMRPLADVRAAFELWRALRRERPDVLHVHNPKPGIYGRIVGRLARVPIVVNTQHGLYATETDAWPKRAAVYTLEAIAARCSHAELVQNPEDLALLRRRRIAPHAQLLGNGVDLERFDPARFGAEERRAIRAELGIGTEQVVIGTVGRLVREKGYPELFAAHAGLDPSRVTMVVIGGQDDSKPDALPEEMLRQARERGVRILGHRDDVERLYAAMDVFVLASHREGYPRAAMEAAAMALPLVVTDVRGCREVVVEGSNGFLVPAGDPGSLAQAITRLASDTDLRARMGRESRNLARERFDERDVVRKVLDTYRAVAAKKHVVLALAEPRR
jgi:glycosyltransferase involved in cell wall biosynthesis